MLCQVCLTQFERTRATYVVAVQFPPDCDECRKDYEQKPQSLIERNGYDDPVVVSSCFPHATKDCTSMQSCPHGHAMRFSEPVPIADELAQQAQEG